MAESSSAYKLRKNCVDSQIKRSSDNREKIDLCQKYDGTQIAEKNLHFYIEERRFGHLSNCRLDGRSTKKFKMRSKSQDLTFQRWKIVRFRHSN